jgi:hypothetical protein
VQGWGFDPKDWESLVKTELCRNSHYNTEVDIHEVKVAPYTYDEGKGYVRPEVVTIVDDLVAMLDRIHAQLDIDYGDNIMSMFNEIGCLIAKAKGEYSPVDHMPDNAAGCPI